MDNFTEKFTRTRVYSRLTDLGFIKFRYERGNHLGVRFEPWHVEVGVMEACTGGASWLYWAFIQWIVVGLK